LAAFLINWMMQQPTMSAEFDQLARQFMSQYYWKLYEDPADLAKFFTEKSQYSVHDEQDENPARELTATGVEVIDLTVLTRATFLEPI
jgi:hypothetical protein